MTAYPADLGPLRTRVLRGVAWTTSAAVTVQVSRLVFGVALARLLTPHEYGLAGMALVFSALVLGVSDFGLGAGLVQRASITEADRSTVFWTSTAIGIVFSAVGIALAGPVAAFYGEPAVEPLFAAVSVGFVVTALGRAHAAVFQRDMAFRAISVRSMAATVAGGGVAVVLAASGEGAWALVGMHLANGVVTTGLMWAFSPWHPRFTYSLASLRSLGAFGANVFGARVCEYLHGTGDKILVGRALGAASLGVYSIAYNLVVLPFVALLGALTDALFPAMSRVQDDRQRLGGAWLSATRLLLAITAPAMLGLVVVAPDLVVVLLGEKWRAAVPVLQLLSVALVVHSAVAFSSIVLMSLDQTGTVLRFNVCEVSVIAVALIVGLQWGIVGVAAAYLAAVSLTRTALGWLTARRLGVPAGVVIRALAGVVVAATAMAVVVWLARLGLAGAGVPAGARLAVVTLLGACVYVPLCAYCSPALAREVRQDARLAAPARLLGALRLTRRP